MTQKFITLIFKIYDELIGTRMDAFFCIKTENKRKNEIKSVKTELINNKIIEIN